MTKPLPVIITPKAENDLTEAWIWLRKRNPVAANQWLEGIHDKILALGAMPEGHQVSHNFQDPEVHIRRALYGSKTRWRIYYAVIDETVQVLHVRHGHRSDWQH